MCINAVGAREGVQAWAVSFSTATRSLCARIASYRRKTACAFALPFPLDTVNLQGRLP